MRQTSRRRRQRHGGGMKYRGASDLTANAIPQYKSLVVPDDDPEGVVCDDCGARVGRLVSGRPKAHAPGGFVPNTRAGRYRCESSGTLVK